MYTLAYFLVAWPPFPPAGQPQKWHFYSIKRNIGSPFNHGVGCSNKFKFYVKYVIFYVEFENVFLPIDASIYLSVLRVLYECCCCENFISCKGLMKYILSNFNWLPKIPGCFALLKSILKDILKVTKGSSRVFFKSANSRAHFEGAFRTSFRFWGIGTSICAVLWCNWLLNACFEGWRPWIETQPVRLHWAVTFLLPSSARLGSCCNPLPQP